MALAVFGRRVEGVFDWKIQAQAVLLQSLGVSCSTFRPVAQPIRADHRRPLRHPFARAAHSAHSLRQTKTLYEGTAVRELPPSSVGPWNHPFLVQRWMFYQRVGSLFCAILAQFVNIARVVEAGVHRLCRK